MSDTGLVIFVVFYLLVVFALVGLVIASFWRIFEKAGQPGWAAIVPIYNAMVILELVGRPVWWFLLFFIPFAGIVFAVIVLVDLARSFGQGVGFGVGLALLPFVFAPMLGFGSARYIGPAANGGTISPRVAA